MNYKSTIFMVLIWLAVSGILIHKTYQMFLESSQTMTFNFKSLDDIINGNP